MTTNREPADGWFQISDSDWLVPKFKHKKLKLLADSQVPQPIVQEIAAVGISVESLDQGARRLSDPDVLSLAESQNRVLLTLDRDFWDDQKFQLHRLRTGIIYIAEPPSRSKQVLRAFGLVYGCFAKSYPLDWWNAMKIRGTIGQFEIKTRTQGKTVRYLMKLNKGFIMAKEVLI